MGRGCVRGELGPWAWPAPDFALERRHELGSRPIAQQAGRLLRRSGAGPSRRGRSRDGRWVPARVRVPLSCKSQCRKVQRELCGLRAGRHLKACPRAGAGAVAVNCTPRSRENLVISTDQVGPHGGNGVSLYWRSALVMAARTLIAQGRPASRPALVHRTAVQCSCSYREPPRPDRRGSD